MTRTLNAIQCRTPIVAPVLGDEEAERLAQVLKAVAESVCVCDLIEPLGLRQPRACR